MRIIISPAKKMTEDGDTLQYSELPVLINKTEELFKYLSERSYEELKNIWRCNDKIAALNFERIKDTDIHGGVLTPAVIAYEGIQYQYLSPKTLEKNALDYLQERLRILSGFYGVLKPMDGVVPYRLEMQSELCPPVMTEAAHSGADCGHNEPGTRSLYEFWGEDIYKEVFSGEDTVINLASKEYSKAVEPYLRDRDRFINCSFCELKDGKLRQKATMAKMARGEAVRFMAENNVCEPEGLKEFSRLGFSFEESFSDENSYVFVK